MTMSCPNCDLSTLEALDTAPLLELNDTSHLQDLLDLDDTSHLLDLLESDTLDYLPETYGGCSCSAS